MSKTLRRNENNSNDVGQELLTYYFRQWSVCKNMKNEFLRDSTTANFRLFGYGKRINS